MKALIGFVTGFFDVLYKSLGWLIDGFLWCCKTLLFVSLDGLLTAVTLIVSTVNLTNLVGSMALSWVGVPPQLVWCINEIGMPAGVAMITAAIGIRMLLNLIPAAFTRI